MIIKNVLTITCGQIVQKMRRFNTTFRSRFLAAAELWRRQRTRRTPNLEPRLAPLGR